MRQKKVRAPRIQAMIPIDFGCIVLFQRTKKNNSNAIIQNLRDITISLFIFSFHEKVRTEKTREDFLQQIDTTIGCAPVRIGLATELPSEEIENIIAFTMALKYKCKQMRVSRIVLAISCALNVSSNQFIFNTRARTKHGTRTIIKFARDTQTHKIAPHTHYMRIEPRKFDGKTGENERPFCVVQQIRSFSVFITHTLTRSTQRNGSNSEH